MRTRSQSGTAFKIRAGEQRDRCGCAPSLSTRIGKNNRVVVDGKRQALTSATASLLGIDSLSARHVLKPGTIARVKDQELNLGGGLWWCRSTISFLSKPYDVLSIFVDGAVSQLTAVETETSIAETNLAWLNLHQIGQHLLRTGPQRNLNSIQMVSRSGLSLCPDLPTPGKKGRCAQTARMSALGVPYPIQPRLPPLSV